METIEKDVESQLEMLKMCVKKVNNYRQSDALDTIISLCEREPVPFKMSKVVVNNHAILFFAMLPESELSSFMQRDIKDLYEEAFEFFGLPDAQRARLHEARKASRQTTTVEVNVFISQVISDAVDRINNLAEIKKLTQEMVSRSLIGEGASLYTATDLRERALLYFATLPADQKTKAISEVASKYGTLLTRLTPKQYEEKRRQIEGS